MLVQRLTQRTARRLLTHEPIVARSFAPSLLASTSSIRLQLRHAAFQASASPSPQATTAKPSDAHAILAKQRLNRPIAPHLSIYRPQLTWYLSGLNRITGSVLSGGFYLFGFGYLVAPLVGLHLESAHLAELFGHLGPVTKGLIKFGVALPFTFHSFNGVRHLVWDTGREFANGQVVRSGWLVIGLTVATSGILAFYPF